MALPRVLFAGDSNLKFVARYVPARDEDQVKVVSVSGASVVKDSTGFRYYLEEALKNYRPDELYLHLGSNDVSRRTAPSRVYCEMRQLIDEVRSIVPDVRVVLCSVLPRSSSAYKDYSWNRFVLPHLQSRVTGMNHALGELCQDLDVEFLKYALEEHHFGVDGLHVRPAGAKHLLFTILGKVKRKCFAPAGIAPCTRKTDITADLDDWPALPSSSLAAKRTVSVIPTWGPVGVRPEKAWVEPVIMPYPRVDCGMVFGWDNSSHVQACVEPVSKPCPRVNCGEVFGWDNYSQDEVEEWKEQDQPGKMYSLKELESKGMMRLDICGVEAYVKPSSFGIKTGLYGGSKKGKKAATNPGKTKRVNLNGAKEYLVRICTSGNESNLKPDGPYGDICELVSGLSNSKMNRKRLQTLWYRLKKSSSDERKADRQTKGKTYRVNTRFITKTSKVSLNTGLVSKDRFDIPKKDIEYVAIGKVLRDNVNLENDSDLGDSGPYASVCSVPGLEISNSNKLFLHRIWKENRENVRDGDNFNFDMKTKPKYTKVNKKQKSVDNENVIEHKEGVREEKETNIVRDENKTNRTVDLSVEIENKEKVTATVEIEKKNELDERNNTEKEQILTLNENKTNLIVNPSVENNLEEQGPAIDYEHNERQSKQINPKLTRGEKKIEIVVDHSIDSENKEQVSVTAKNEKTKTFYAFDNNIETPFNQTPEKTIMKNDKEPVQENADENKDLATNESFVEYECASDDETDMFISGLKHKFDQQYWDEQLKKNETKSILQMLEVFFSDNESNRNSIHIKLLSVYKKTKVQISSFKKFSENDIDLEKEYKTREEMFMQNLLSLDSLKCLPIHKYIKKSIVYMNNCALTALDRLYKKTKNKSAEACRKESKNNSPGQDETKNTPVQDSQSSVGISGDKFSCDQTNEPLSRETISSILEVEIPERYFTKEISRFVSFNICENDMKNLLLNRTERSFKRDSWQSIFLQKIKESNPYCCFQISRSRLSTATKRSRKSGSPFFLVEAKCTFNDCSIKLKLEMQDKSKVNVSYTGDLKHDIKEIRYRPIKGNDRDQLKNKFEGGKKPMAHYLDRLQQLPTEHLVSGNRDGLGKNSRVFAQIAAESRQGGRMDDSVFESLQELKEEMNRKVEGGFIQKICASPCYVLYWSKFGINLYNERAKKDALYWDATGSVVRKQEDGKQFLYYELAIRNPIKGKMGIPLTAMITTDQSLPTILDWLRCFRQAEKQKFGHNSKRIVSFPKLIVSDQAMVFILAALKEFNGESLDDFLSRAWKIVFSKADVDDTCKTIVHLCASHFMHTAKLYLRKKDIGGHKLKMFLYMIGLLLNCSSIQDAQELLNDIYIILGSNAIHNGNQKFYNRLIKKINNFNSMAEEISECIDEIKEKSENINPGRFTEEEFQVLGSTSPFKEWSNKIMSKAQNMIFDMSQIKQTELFVNPLYSPSFTEYLNKRLMPLYPLWGSLLMGNLTRYNDNYHPFMTEDNDCLFNSINNVGKTNSTIENRFRILKDICLGGRTQHRLDEFSERLKTSTIGIQKLVALDCLKYPSFIKSPSKRQTKALKRKMVGSCSTKNKKQKTLVHEQWNKARPQPDNLKANLGKYQQAPQEEIKLKQTPVKRKNDNNFQADDGFSPIKTRRQNKPTNMCKNNNFQKVDLKTDEKTELISSQFCSLSNFGNSCWFNSVLQALAHCQMSTRVLESNDLCIDLTGNEQSNPEIAIHDIIQVWKYMKNPKFFGTQVPDKLLRSAFRSVVAAIPGFSLRHQQDAHEFNSSIIADMANSLTDNTLKYHFTEECCHCKNARIREANVGQSVILDIEGIDNVSIQSLISSFLLGDSSFRKCNSCKNETEHTIKQKIITNFPRTLMILLRRYKIEYLGERNIVSQKLHNNIHVSSEFCLVDQKDFEVNYQLKSTVCHHGNSTNAGHYNTVIKHNDEFICCDDKRISLVDSDYTLSTAYLVIYDRVDPSLPLYVEPFINCWRQTKGIIESLKVMKLNPLINGKTNLLEDIHKVGMTESVEAIIKENLSLELSMNNISEVDFYSRLIKYLVQTDEGTETLFRDNFNVCTNHIRLCSNCGLVDTQLQNLLTLSVKNFSLISVHECLTVLQGERVIRMCRCGSIPDVFIMSLPSTLVIKVEDCSNLHYENIQTFSISDNFKEVYPIGCKKYHLKSIYGHKNGHFVTCIQTDTCIMPMLNDKELHSFAGFDNIILFFDRESFSFEPERELLPILKNDKLSQYPFLKIPKQITIDIKIQTDASLFGVKLAKDFFPTLLDTSAWLSSDHINIYMSLLAKESLLKVHSVNSVWFSQRMVKDSDPQKLQLVFHETESKQKWFDFDYILIPVNENGSHWTIAVVQIREKQIFYCNSLPLGENANIICHQVWRYICYEALLHSGLVLQKNEWSTFNYNDFPGFPMQTDGSSCGVYICAVAKAIVFKQRLPKESNLLNFRNCMANEINTLSLYM